MTQKVLYILEPESHYQLQA